MDVCQSLSKEYEDKVKEFIRFAVEHTKNPSRIICHCLDYCYSREISADQLEDHLVCNRIDQSYTCWTRHGEKRNKAADHDLRDSVRCTSSDPDTNTYECDRVEKIANVVEEDLQDCPDIFDRLVSDAHKPLYDGCTKFTRLSAVLKLYNLKVRNGWSDKSFIELLTLLKDMLPEDNVLPSRMYEAKRMLSSIGMSYEQIHTCPNDCILFRNEYASLNKCPKCNVLRYKKKNSVPCKVVWYFPIIPRFRCMYHSAEDVKHLTWHAEEKLIDGKLWHPMDSPQWMKNDYYFLDFGQQVRNLHLALSIDRMNPHGMQSNSHSTWPMVIIIYNLPPWLCMKRKFMMLSMLISSPKQPATDIDIYLAPLIEDLKHMWDTGVEVYDGYKKESFNLRAMLFCTINDCKSIDCLLLGFIAYGPQ